jgi:hypothetical protein
VLSARGLKTLENGVAIVWEPDWDFRHFGVSERRSFFLHGDTGVQDPEARAFAECPGPFIVVGGPHPDLAFGHTLVVGVFTTREAAEDWAEVLRVEAALS